MFRRLTLRGVLPVAVAITGFVVVCCVLLYAIIKKDMTNGAFAQQQSLAATVVKSARYTMLKADREGLANIVANVGSGEGVEHLRILNPEGLVAFSSNRTETAPPPGKRLGMAAAAGFGRRPTSSKGSEVLAIRVPIANEEACFTAPCHFHRAEQKELGVLEIGISTQALQQNLALMRGRMFLFCVMILFLTIGGVAALLQRSVFTPLRLLTEYSQRIARGETEAPPPGYSGELGDLAANLKLTADQLRATRVKRGATNGRATGFEEP